MLPLSDNRGYFSLVKPIGTACLIFCFLSWSSHCQESFYGIEQFTLDDGLPQASINDILVDDMGFVWLATGNGLARFDGNNFKYYLNREGDSLSLSNNYINGFEFDPQGNIWIATNGSGIDVFNSSHNSFNNLSLKNFGMNFIINSIDGFKDEMFFSSSQYGVFHFDTTNREFIEAYPLTDVTSIFIDDENEILWIGDLHGNIYKSDLNYPLNPKLEITLSGNIQAFHREENLLFIGSYDGLYLYDVQKGSYNLLELEQSQTFLTKHVVDFLAQDDDSIWVATGRGLYLLSTESLTTELKIEYGSESRRSLTNNTVTTLHKLNDERLLVGTANGLNLVHFKSPYFQNISKDKNGTHLLNDNVVFSIHKSGEDLLIGTSDGGLNYIRGDKVYRYLDYANSPNTFVGSVVREICEDTINKRFWFATTRGLSMVSSRDFDPENPSFEEFKANPEDTNTITSNFLKGLALDKNHNVWGAAYQYGIFRLEYFDKENYKVTRFVNEDGNLNSLINDVSQCIRVDDDNKIWIGTGGGLSILEFEDLNYTKPKFRHFNSDSITNPNSFLTHNSVYDITFVDNVVWVGTANGLNRINEDGTVDRWYAQDQFPDTFVYSIQDDNEGNLWLGTNDGLIRFNPNTEKFTRFTEHDQIQSKEFNIHSRFKDDDGTIYMGGIGGVTYFQPKLLHEIDQPMKLYFSKLELKNHTIEPYQKDQYILQKDISETSEIQIAHNQFPFYLTFTNIDFGFDRDIQYAYKLLPSDNEWNALEDNKIQFLNLPWGKHSLLVNGFSRGEQWKIAPLTMTIQINPPWWLSSYMLLVYVVLLVLLAYWFYKFSVSRKLARAESTRLRELQTLRSNLYTNITHEFRTPLTVILGMADKLKIHQTNNRELFKPVRLIERNGKRMLTLINNLLDLSKIEDGNVKLNWIQADIVPYIKYLAESFQTLAEQKDIQLMLFTEIEHLDMDYDEEVIQIIISNLVSNALKFTPKFGRIVMKISKGTLEDRDAVIIKIRDDGMGIPKEHLDKIFNRFYQVETNISKSGIGTGIGLALVKQLVSLLKGDISVKSDLGSGSEFLIKLPIYNEAPIKNGNFDVKISKESETIFNEELIDFVENEDAPHILIVEDNEDVAYYIKTCLEDYQVSHALSGKKGLEIAVEEIPDIVICDLMMPEMDGFEVCNRLKTNDKTDHIPLIMLTAKDTDEDKLKGLAIGIEAYLTKPFNKEELLTRIDTLILQRKRLQEKYKQVLLPNFNNHKTIDTPKFLKKIDTIIHECINNPDLNSQMLSDKMAMSESQIYRKLKALTNKSTAIYIRKVRLQRGYELLLKGEKTVAEIAYDIGFTDPSWFSRSFKEEFGCTPSSVMPK